MDFEIVRYCNELGRGTLDPLTLFLSDIRFLVALWLSLGIAAVWLDRENGRRAFLVLVVAIVLHFAISEGIFKHLIEGHLVPIRVRPYLAHPAEIVPVGTLFRDSSFPSSHNASTAAAIVALCTFYRRAIPLGVAFVLAMAFARMHNGMHYPTDVLAGIVLGTGYCALALRVSRGRVRFASRAATARASEEDDATKASPEA